MEKRSFPTNLNQIWQFSSQPGIDKCSSAILRDVLSLPSPFETTTDPLHTVGCGPAWHASGANCSEDSRPKPIESPTGVHIQL